MANAPLIDRGRGKYTRQPFNRQAWMADNEKVGELLRTAVTIEEYQQTLKYAIEKNYAGALRRAAESPVSRTPQGQAETMKWLKETAATSKIKTSKELCNLACRTGCPHDEVTKILSDGWARRIDKTPGSIKKQVLQAHTTIVREQQQWENQARPRHPYAQHLVDALLEMAAQDNDVGTIKTALRMQPTQTAKDRALFRIQTMQNGRGTRLLKPDTLEGRMFTDILTRAGAKTPELAPVPTDAPELPLNTTEEQWIRTAAALARKGEGIPATPPELRDKFDRIFPVTSEKMQMTRDLWDIGMPKTYRREEILEAAIQDRDWNIASTCIEEYNPNSKKECDRLNKALRKAFKDNTPTINIWTGKAIQSLIEKRLATKMAAYA